MAGKDYYSMVSEKRKKKEEQVKTSPSKDYYSLVGKRRIENEIGFDTFASDYNSTLDVLRNAHSGWQSSDDMNNTRPSVEAMQKRVDLYNEYKDTYGVDDGNDLSYSLLEAWDELSSAYGQYGTAEAFDHAKKSYEMEQMFRVQNDDGTFRGLTYDEVQEKKKEYAEDSDEYKFLDKYTGFTDLTDFDKAIEVEKGAKKTDFYLEPINFDASQAGKVERLTKEKNATNHFMEQQNAGLVERIKNPSLSNETVQEDRAYLEELETKRNQHAIDNAFDLYKDLMNAEDFEETSQYVSTKVDGKWKRMGTQYGLGYGDLIYEYINNVDGIRDEIEHKASIYGVDTSDSVSSMEKKNYDLLTEDEVKVYNSLYKEDKKNGTNKAEKFLDDMEVTLGKRAYTDQTAEWEATADSGFLASAGLSALSVPASLVGGITGGIEMVGDALMGKDYNPYSYYKNPTNFAYDVREYVGENIAEETEDMELFGQNIPSFLYGVGMSRADSIVGGALFKGNAMSAILGSSAAQQRAKELTEEGASQEEIMRGAMVAGGAEFFGEKFGYSELMKAKDIDSVWKIFTAGLKQSGSETLEESATEVLNILGDIWNRGEDSDFKQTIADYKERGFDDKEAFWNTFLDFGGDVIWAGIGGALSGGPAGSIKAAGDYSNLSHAGKQIRANDRVGEMADLFDIMEMQGLTPEQSEAYKLYGEYLQKKDVENLSNARLGNLYQTSNREAYEDYFSKKSTQTQKTDAEKRLLKLNEIATERPLDEVARRKCVEELNVGEVTEVTSTGNSTKIEGVRFEDGSTIVLTSEGEVKAEDMTFSANDAEILAYAEGMSQEKANVFVAQYDGKSDVDSYIESFEMAYAYGEVGMDADSVLRNKGVLTEKQASEIYKNALINRVGERQKAIDAINKKQSGNVFVKGRFDDSIIDYEGTVTDGSKVAWKDLTSTQREAVTFAKGFSEAAGVNITFIKSDVKNGKRVGKNGSYNPVTNTIEIDVYAGIDDVTISDDFIIPTLSHEMTHWMKAKAPAMYSKIQAHALETLKMQGITTEDRVNAEINRMKENHPDMEVTKEMAVDEIVARYCEDMLSNSKTAREFLGRMSESEQKSFIAKVKETFTNLMDWVNKLLGQYKSKSKEAAFLREYNDRLKEVSKMWDKALEEAVQSNQGLQAEGINGEKVEIQHDDRIVIREGMTDEERYNILKNKSISLIAKVDTKKMELAEEKYKISSVHSLKESERKKLFKKLGEEFNVFKGYTNKDVELSFVFSKGNMSESEKKQEGNYGLFAKMFSCFDDVIESAIGIEIHNRNKEGYKPDVTLKTVYVLVSAFEDGGNIVPVKLEIKEFVDKNNTLYVAIALESINKDEVVKEGNTKNSVTQTSHSSIISLSDLFANINPSDERFLKYVPKQFFEHIQYSDREKVSVYDVMGETESLKKQNELLKADVEALKERLKLERQVTHGNTFNAKQLKAVAKHLLNISKSDYSENTLVEELREVYSYIVETSQLDWEVLMSKSYDVARRVLDASKGYKVTNNYFKDVLADIRSARISLSEEQIQEAKNVYGEKYRNAFMGRVMLVKNGTSLDQKWQEWSDLYPEIFDANVTGADQITALSEIYDSLREGAEIYQTYNDVESIRAFATEIYNQYWNVSTVTTTADKYDKQIKKLNFEHRKAMSELRNDYKQRLTEQKTADAIHYGKIVNRIKERNQAELAEAKRLGKQRMSDYRNRVARKQKIERIKKNAKMLNEYLVRNSKEKHINEELKPMVRSLVQAIDYSTGAQAVKKYEEVGLGLSPTSDELALINQSAETAIKAREEQKLLDALYKVQKSLDSVEFYGMGIEGEIDELVKDLEELKENHQYPLMVLNAMSLEHLETVDKLVRAVKSVVLSANKLHTIKRNSGVDGLGMEITTFLDKLGTGNTYNDKIEKFVKALKWDNTVPYYAFKRLGDGGKVLFGSLQDGWDRLAFNLQRVLDFTEETYDEKDVNRWCKEVKDFTVGNTNFKMTVAQIMSLSCLYEREQGRKHILGNGIRIGNFGDGVKVVNQPKNIKVTEADVKAIISVLSPKQEAVAKKLRGFMNDTCTEWGNYVSMERFGYKAFVEDNYFPIEVDENNISKDKIKDNKNVSLYALLNMGFTKSVNEKSKNALVVNDIFDVFANHASEMAKYNALGLAVLDFNRVMNHTEMKDGSPYSIRTAMEIAYGKDAEMYFNKLIADLNGTQNVSRDMIGKGFMAKAKLGAIAWNLKTVMLQPTAYLKASAILDKRYLVSSVITEPHLIKRGIDRAKKYCGIARWKSMGFYDTNVSRSVVDKIKCKGGLYDSLTEKSTEWMEKADEITFGALWNACELETKNKRKDLDVRSDEFYKVVAERLREVIYATQVVDSTLTRSEMMRSGDAMDKMLTAFGSEPILAYNMLLDTVMQTSILKRSGASKEELQKNKRNVRRVVDAYIQVNLVTAIIETFVGAYRDDDELEESELIEMLMANFLSNMSIIGKIPYFKDVVSIFKGYSASRLDTQGVQSAYYAIEGVKKNLQGEGNVATTVKHSIKAFSYLSGLGFYNAYRDIMATLNRFDVLTADELEELLNKIIE